MPLYTIGNFAALNKISTRMLRHYDKIGLFKPCELLENGYRVYSSEQIETMGLIKKYRLCNFSLDEIAQLLAASEITKKLMIERKLTQLKAEENITYAAYKELSNLYPGLNTILDNHYEISTTNRVELDYISSDFFTNADDFEIKLDELHNVISNHKFKTSGFSMLLSNFGDHTFYKAAIPVRESRVTNEIVRQTLESGKYISTFHFGDYCNIGFAYDKIFEYLKSNQLTHSGFFIEKFFLDAVYTQNSLEYITEISVRITP